MKIHFGLLIVILFFGCKANYKFLGKYGGKGGNAFQFKKDSTFIFQYRVPYFEYSSGKWTKGEKNDIILNSRYKTIIPLTVSESPIGNLDRSNILSIDLEIVDGMGLADYECDVFLNDSLYISRRCDSISFLKVDRKIETISLEFRRVPRIRIETYSSSPIKTEIFKLKNSQSNKVKVKISLNENLFFYKAFNGEVVKLGNNHIKIYDRYLKRWIKITKLRQAENIFSKFRGDWE